MSDYLERVIEEESELSAKIQKLENFITTNSRFNSLPAIKQTRLTLQLLAMLQYQKILQLRINDAG